jgi:hypothetical protein
MRILKSRPDPHPRGEYLTAMNAKLDAYVKAHCPTTDVTGWESRKTLTRESLIALHEEAGCRWFHKGDTVTQGAWVVAPSLVMAEREGR